MNRAIFLDRDGVINKVIMKNGNPYSPRKFEEFELLPGIKTVLINFKNNGFQNIIVTNQPDIARNLMEWDELNKIHDYIRKELPIDDIRICPHDDSYNCECRKPKPGMLYKAAGDFDIDLKKSFVIGDRWKDIEAGRCAGCNTILINAVYNKDVSADFKVNDLLEACDLIFAIFKK